MSDKILQKSSRWTWKTTVGVAIVLLGVVALVQNYIGFSPSVDLDGNWWVYFILIPAFFNLGAALKAARESNGFSLRAAGLVIGGLCMLLLVPIFLLNLDWVRVWPLFVIAAGVGVVFVTLVSSIRI